MQSKYGLTRKELKQPFVHHNACPGAAFFPWLKNQMNGPIKISIS
ncbi:Uncharacterised protein [Klebsiella quasipneumoniae]|nr:Uncharacterised protein [Klebsiella quasipneumoniae]